jgi:ribosomal 50S subunit-associated protein YjgA (DUF615 family)
VDPQVELGDWDAEDDATKILTESKSKMTKDAVAVQQLRTVHAVVDVVAAGSTSAPSPSSESPKAL